MIVEELKRETSDTSAVLVEYKCDHLESFRWYIVSRSIPAEVDHPPKIVCVDCLQLIQAGVTTSPTYRIKKAFLLDGV